MRRGSVMGRKPEWWRYFWVNAGWMTAVLTVFDIASYLLKVWDFYGLAQAILLTCCANLVMFALLQMMLDVLPFKTVYRESRILYTVSGASYGTVLGIGLGVLIYWAFNIPQPATTSELWFTGFLFFGLSAIVGAFVGYWIGKRRGFRTQGTGFRTRVTRRRETDRSIDETDEDE